MALPQLAPECDEPLALRHRLDTLRDQAQPERPRQIHDRAHDVQVESTSPDAMHDRAVELDPLPSPGRNSLRQVELRSSRGRTRTCDPPVNSRLLYQLSYSGMKREISSTLGG